MSAPVKPACAGTRVCDDIEMLAMAYVDEELAREDVRELELHVRECDGCRDAVAVERTARQGLRDSLAVPLPTPVRSALWLRVQAGLEAVDREERGPRATAQVRRWWLPVGSSVAAAAAVLLFVSSATRPVRSDGQMTTVATSAAVPVPQVSAVTPTSSSDFAGASPGMPMAPMTSVGLDSGASNNQPVANFVGRRRGSYAGVETLDVVIDVQSSAGGQTRTIVGKRTRGPMPRLALSHRVSSGQYTFAIDERGALVWVDGAGVGFVFASPAGMSARELATYVVGFNLVPFVDLVAAAP